METTVITEDQTGCWLDNHRGHYIGRDVIQLAVGFGFIISEVDQYVVNLYETHNNDESYPHEGMQELCDEAEAWLNSGQSDCNDCVDGYAPTEDYYIDKAGDKRCKTCTGTGRGDRIAGQNFPPRVPEGYVWEFNDGDFGLYQYDEDGNPVEPS